MNRMDERNCAERCYQYIPKGKRRRGRAYKRWKNQLS